MRPSTDRRKLRMTPAGLLAVAAFVIAFAAGGETPAAGTREAENFGRSHRS